MRRCDNDILMGATTLSRGPKQDPCLISISFIFAVIVHRWSARVDAPAINTKVRSPG